MPKRSLKNYNGELERVGYLSLKKLSAVEYNSKDSAFLDYWIISKVGILSCKQSSQKSGSLRDPRDILSGAISGAESSSYQ